MQNNHDRAMTCRNIMSWQLQVENVSAHVYCLTFEPAHDKTYNKTFAISEDPDQAEPSLQSGQNLCLSHATFKVSRLSKEG